MIISFPLVLVFIISFLHLIIVHKISQKSFNLHTYFSVLIRYLGVYAASMVFLFLFGLKSLSEEMKSILMAIGAISILWLSIQDIVEDFSTNQKKKKAVKKKKK